MRVGMIGMGLMGSVHCQALLDARTRFPELTDSPPELVACADESEEQIERAVSLFGFKRVTTDWKEVIDADDIDVVMITSPNWTHHEFATYALAAGKPVFCEKPVGRAPSETMQVVGAARSSGVRSMVGYVYRWAPMVRHAGELIKSGAIGEITHYHGRFLVGYAKDPNTPLSWRFDSTAAGYGALGDLMSHVLDLSHFLAGPVSELVSERHTFISQRPVPSQSHSSVFGAVGTDIVGEVTNEDYVSALIRLENGARGHLETCRVMSGPVCQMAFDIHGTKGAISWNLERMNELVLTENDDPDSAKTTLSGPSKPGQEHFWPGSGVGIGYESIVAIQAAAMTTYMTSGQGEVPTLEAAGYVASAQQAMIDSWKSGGWTAVQRV